MTADQYKAPEHLVQMLAANMPEPRSPYPQPEKWAAHVRDLTNLIWASAFHAGTEYGLSIKLMTEPQRMLVVTEEERRALLERLDGEAPPEADRGSQ